MVKQLRIWNILTIALLVFLCACNRDSDKDKLVGIWEHAVDYSLATAGEEFRKDGTYRYWYSGSKIRTEDTGTYRMEGKRVTVKVTKHVATNGKVTDPDNEHMFSILKVDDHELKILDHGEVFVLTRQK